MTPPTRAAIVAATRVAAPASGQPPEVVEPGDPECAALVRATLHWKAALLGESAA